MRLLNKIILACAWIAILATTPYVYSNRNTLEAWGVLLFLGVVLIVGIATVFLFVSLLDKD
jgi:hypothetical protein